MKTSLLLSLLLATTMSFAAVKNAPELAKKSTSTKQKMERQLSHNKKENSQIGPKTEKAPKKKTSHRRMKR